jgi:hypothetical protein
MRAHECYHCKQWVEEDEAHDCWTTTEAALTRDLSEDLQDAYERLRESATELGEQRIYASHHSIMFARKSCYFFVRPKKKFLEVCLFLGRPINAPQVKRIEGKSKTKIVNIVHVTHRDQVEAPITDWLREAYELPDRLEAAKAAGAAKPRKPTPARKTAPSRKTASKRKAATKASRSAGTRR